MPVESQSGISAEADGAAGSRLDRKCGLGVSFDLKIGRLAFGHETAASVLAAFLVER
jgi:hypothetical protein